MAHIGAEVFERDVAFPRACCPAKYDSCFGNTLLCIQIARRHLAMGQNPVPPAEGFREVSSAVARFGRKASEGSERFRKKERLDVFLGIRLGGSCWDTWAMTPSLDAGWPPPFPFRFRSREIVYVYMRGSGGTHEVFHRQKTYILFVPGPLLAHISTVAHIILGYLFFVAMKFHVLPP